MKTDVKIGATIPVAQYANIQPEIYLHDVDAQEGFDYGIGFIKSLFAQYSEKGELTEKELVFTAVKQSFNENVKVSFEPIKHIYVGEDGKPLTSVTKYIERFYKPFDAQNISMASAKAWGVEQETVQDLWKSNGQLTAGLGTVVHQALEHYMKFRDVGQQIQEKKEMLENYAMPKHPLLKSMIEGFIAINKTEGDTSPEALVTDVENGLCGQSDLILVKDWEKKVCRVQDYKINVNAEEIKSTDKPLAPFDHLPANKLSKYQLQLSVYANMLQKSGWTVEGLDVFVYEDGWKHFELDVLKVVN